MHTPCIGRVGTFQFQRKLDPKISGIGRSRGRYDAVGLGYPEGDFVGRGGIARYITGRNP